MKTSNTMSRREFHRKVGEGMLWAGLGSALAAELGLSRAWADEIKGDERLLFGDLEPLVAFMQDTPVEKLQALVVEKLQKREATLDELLQAAALANARSFAGEDYVGMHTLMAMKPALHMARRLPSDRSALAVLKILYRNTAQIHAQGETHKMHAVAAHDLPEGADGAKLLREAVHAEDAAKAESIFAKIAAGSAEEAFNDLLHVVADDTEVHRVVFAQRSWDIVDLAGLENAEAMLRQSLRYCLKAESRAAKSGATARTLLPKLLDEHKLLDRQPGTRRMDDQWVATFCETILTATPEEAAGAVAEALAEGVSARDLGEAISLATNQLVLRDAGRPAKWASPGKPEGSVHGDSIGVHASDAAHAWRGIAQISNPRNAVTCLILAGYQAARDRVQRGGEFLAWKPRPHDEHLAKIAAKDNDGLLRELDAAVREQNQAMACALVHRLGEQDADPRVVTDMLLRYATSEDGALHAEKYFLTTTDNFATTRAAYQWEHLVGLARVTASEAGTKAAGYSEACELLGVEA